MKGGRLEQLNFYFSSLNFLLRTFARKCYYDHIVKIKNMVQVITYNHQCFDFQKIKQGIDHRNIKLCLIPYSRLFVTFVLFPFNFNGEN